MASQTSGTPRLDVGAALRDGWAAFGRAPWILSGFLLLMVAFNLLLEALQTTLTSVVADLPPFFQLAPLLCVLVSWALNLWTMVGLVRGAWITLEGRRPME